ncbi:unnamed protein product [Paramecium primaurelia]|uniref:Queuosine 5'-phosphate N-glycosylase/hydrolase n=1 Tax=Paramecium primaurelia TaxID=5886 RepID=A0A8S1NE04_PARPR|nr:unnamed protein product [Paramecium primaurelia]
MTFEEFLKLLFPKFPEFRLVTERYRLLQHALEVLFTFYEGEFVSVIKAANNSAAKLLNILITQFLGFQDHEINKSFFQQTIINCKGDIYAALKGLVNLMILKSQQYFQIIEFHKLQINQIQKIKLIPHGLECEIEIRANSIIPVELIKEEFKKLGQKLNSIEVDWILWQIVEEQ